MDTTLSDDAVGLTLDGRYRVDARIAQGGMATVYVGHDLRLDRRVALKIMHSALASDTDFVGRFTNEAKAVARLSHPNVVAVYDQGADSGRVYLAMEYVPGQTLRDQLRRRVALSPREALEIMVPVLGGLSAAHHAGLVHRDVKPENVLLTEDGRVKVADFGLARAVAASRQTKTGMLIGTVAYLPPEQVTHGVCDARGDVYAAGIMLFEMLTGRHPHTGDTPLAVAYQHVNEVVPAPSSLVAGIPQALDALVAMATSRDAELRPADAGHFLQAVFEVLRGLPGGDAVPVVVAAPVEPGDDQHTEAIGVGNGTLVVPLGERPANPATRHAGGPPPDDGERPGRWITSRPITVVGITVLVLALLAGVGWWVLIGRWSDAPSLIGKPVAAAKRQATDLGFTVRVGQSRYDADVPAGKVSGTDPQPGGKVERHGTITIFPSKGARTTQIPDMSGKSVGDAKAGLSSAGLHAGTVKYQFDPQVAKGTVIGTDPAAGTKQRLTTPVDLIVSKGIQLPDVRNQDIGAASGTLSGLGLKVAQSAKYSDKPQNMVLAQHPKPGSGVNSGDLIQLIVSKGPQQVPIPDLGGKAAEDAKTALRQLGFKVKVVRVLDGDKVFRTDPSGQAPKGTLITVYAGP